MKSIDQDLVPTAIVEYQSAKSAGKSDAEAWGAAISRLRYDVFQIAINLCITQSITFEPASPQLAGVQACIKALQTTLRDLD